MADDYRTPSERIRKLSEQTNTLSSILGNNDFVYAHSTGIKPFVNRLTENYIEDDPLELRALGSAALAASSGDVGLWLEGQYQTYQRGMERQLMRSMGTALAADWLQRTRLAADTLQGSIVGLWAQKTGWRDWTLDSITVDSDADGISYQASLTVTLYGVPVPITAKGRVNATQLVEADLTFENVMRTEGPEHWRILANSARLNQYQAETHLKIPYAAYTEGMTDVQSLVASYLHWNFGTHIQLMDIAHAIENGYVTGDPPSVPSVATYDLSDRDGFYLTRGYAPSNDQNALESELGLSGLDYTWGPEAEPYVGPEGGMEAEPEWEPEGLPQLEPPPESG